MTRRLVQDLPDAGYGTLLLQPLDETERTLQNIHEQPPRAGRDAVR